MLGVRTLIIVLTSLVGAGWLLWTGPIPVIVVSTVTDEICPFWYLLSAFPVLGVLVADLVDFAVKRQWRLAVELGVQLALLVGLSQARLALHLPLSGHALLFAFVAIRRLVVAHPTAAVRWAEGLAAALLLGVVVWVKVMWWGDPITIAVGVAVGGLLSAASWKRQRA